MAETDRQSKKPNVFISYSRDDLAFADQLDASLQLGGFETTIDRRGISGGEDWKTRLGALIRDADTVAFVLSPSSAQSPICAWEVAEAVLLGKRIIPVLSRSLEDAKPPRELADRDYIYFYAEPKLPGSGFGPGLLRLAAALNTDLDWLREHTRYLQRATEWDAGGRVANRLLSGPDIALGQAWAARRPKDAPEPTSLQLDFIKASEAEEAHQHDAEARRLREVAEAQAAREQALVEREEAQKREAEQARLVVRRTRIGAAVALVLAVASMGFAFVAYEQREAALQATQRANEQRAIAEEATQRAQSELDSEMKATQQAHEQSELAKAQAELARQNARTADEERDRALLQESHALAILAQEASAAGDQPTAMLLALCALPDPGFGGERPFLSMRPPPWIKRGLETGRQHSWAIGMRSAQRRSAPTERMWSPRPKTRRRGCGIFAAHGRASSPSRDIRMRSSPRRSAPTARTWSRRPWTRRRGCGTCAGRSRPSSPSKGIRIRSSPPRSAPTARMWSQRPWTRRCGCGTCAGRSRPSSPSRDIRIRSSPRRSAPTARTWSRRPWTRRRGCGTCAGRSRPSSPSKGIRKRSTPRRSARTGRMW